MRRLFCSLLLLFTAVGAFAGVDIWTASSYENIFRDAVKTPESSSTFDLVMAKNEAESFQIILRSDMPLVIYQVSLSDLEGAGRRISSKSVSYNFVEYEFMAGNTALQTPETLLRTGAMPYPDPLSNNPTAAVRRNEAQPVWITVHAPKNSRAGNYKGTVDFKTNRGDYSVEYSVELADIAIPDSHESNFLFMHHQQIAGTWYYDAVKGHHPQDVITQVYGWKRWTPEWWELVGDMARKLKDSRCNVLFVNTQQLLLDGDTTLKNGKFHFDWSRFDEYIRFFLDREVVQKLEGLHFGSVIGAVGVTFESYILKNNEQGVLCSSNVEPMGEDCRTFFSQFVPALHSHLKEKGWLDMWIQHVGDEAVSDLQHDQYAYYLDMITSLAPGMDCGDPTFTLASALNSVAHGGTVVTPIEQLYQAYKPDFDALQAKGVDVYVYNCCGPEYSWLNRFIDKPVWQQRSLGWLCYKWGVPGWLHWGWNFWVDWDQDKYHTIAEEWVKGDHYTVYPDQANNMVKNSMRGVAVRDMSEDYELLLALGKKDRELALRLVDRIAVNAENDYTTDVKVMQEVRRELIRSFAQYK